MGVFLSRFDIPTDFVALLDEWAARFFEELDYVHEVRPFTGRCAVPRCTAWAMHLGLSRLCTFLEDVGSLGN